MLLKQEYTINTNMTFNEVIDKLSSNIRRIKPGIFGLITRIRLIGEQRPLYGSFDDKDFCIYPTAYPLSHTIMSLKGEVIENMDGVKINVTGKSLTGIGILNNLTSMLIFPIMAYYVLTYTDIPANTLILMWSLVFIGIPIVNILNGRICIKKGINALQKLFEDENS